MTASEMHSIMTHLPIEASLSGGDSVFSEEQKDTISMLYRSLLHKEIRKCSCKSRYSDACMELMSKLKEMENKYNLKRGMIIWIGTDCYNTDTLTDELAEQWYDSLPSSCDKKAVWERYFGETPAPKKAKSKTTKKKEE